MVHSSPSQPKQHHCSSAISETLFVQAFMISKSFVNSCARNGVAAFAVEGKGVVCFCCICYFMEVSLYLASKTPSLREGNSWFISMDALFLHIRSAVLLCQSSR